MDEKILELLQEMQKDIKGMKQDISDLKVGQVEIKDDLKEIKGDILKLDIKAEDTKRSIKLMQLDINKIETITNYNLNDIATLKAIK
ncbi:hypothetical protein [Clostridioides difficile]|uniref:hypothetical protein n=1 Tax=Clostridioides difficile TaxID=1496 RepID=UPI000BD3C4E4|nr:hypothetical protein [Clostridioides difficile]EGT5564509.1 hypothetical protein [Clostridioides difficile]MDF3817626.1 hypothetical protein [Clostridioides difficile]PBG28869.1 hypothetical protein BGU81_07060 [Clostridioides difficile]HBF4283294.1 hypothetical protein [Clostridioides difficile]HBF5048949.1 hypothetical protein [Clostridioides difficile]